MTAFLFYSFYTIHPVHRNGRRVISSDPPPKYLINQLRMRAVLGLGRN